MAANRVALELISALAAKRLAGQPGPVRAPSGAPPGMPTRATRVGDDRVTETAAEALARLYDLDLVRGPGRPRPAARARRAGRRPGARAGGGLGPARRPARRGGPRGHGRGPRPGDARPGPRRRGRAPGRGRRGRRPPRRTATRATVRLPDAGAFRLAFIPLNSIFLMGVARRPGRAPSRRSPPTSPRAGSRWSTPGCPTPRTSPATTAASCSSGSARTRDRPDRDQGRQPRPTIPPRAPSVLTTIFEEGQPGERAGALGPRATACGSSAPTSSSPSRRRPACRRDARRRLRARARSSAGAERVVAGRPRGPEPAGGPARPSRRARMGPSAPGPVPERLRGRVGPMPDQIRLLVVEDVPQVAQYIRGLLELAVRDQAARRRQRRLQGARPDLRAAPRRRPGRRAAPGPGQGPQPRRPDPRSPALGVPVIVLTVPAAAGRGRPGATASTACSGCRSPATSW